MVMLQLLNQVRHIKTPRKRHVGTTRVDRSYRSLEMIGNIRKSSGSSGWNWFSFGTSECPACLSLLLPARSLIHPQTSTLAPSPALDGFSGIPLLYIRVAPVTCKLWFVLPLIPVFLKIVATIASGLFQPTGVTENQGFEGSRGMLFSGVQ